MTKIEDAIVVEKVSSKVPVIIVGEESSAIVRSAAKTFLQTFENAIFGKPITQYDKFINTVSDYFIAINEARRDNSILKSGSSDDMDVGDTEEQTLIPPRRDRFTEIILRQGILG